MLHMFYKVASETIYVNRRRGRKKSENEFMRKDGFYKGKKMKLKYATSLANSSSITWCILVPAKREGESPLLFMH